MNVELDGIVQIGNAPLKDEKFITVIFSTNVDRIVEGYHDDETLKTKLFTLEEIKEMKDNIRSYDLLIKAIEKVFDNNIMPLNMIEERR